MTKIKAAIIGAAGYTGGEAIRILVNHPDVDIVSLVSRSQADKPVSTIHQDVTGSLTFTPELSDDPDVIFLCMGHGKSRSWVSEYTGNAKIIDLSQDYRLQDTADTFVYGLPEFQRDNIQKAHHIANPGCFATGIQLALLPLASVGLINDEVHINGITGSTGAGQSLSSTSHFSWRNNNVSLYKEFDHQHLAEIGETLNTLSGDEVPELNFIPVRGNFPRGILVSAYTKYDGSENEISELYKSYYADAAFTTVVENKLHLKQVVNTNNALVNVMVKNGKVLITSVIDNLLKGASGQAVQNMNLLFGLEETSGLKLKASYF